MRCVLATSVIATLFACSAIAQEPSLGDVARQTRQKEKAKGAAKKKVLTNEDMPESPNYSPGDLETVGPAQPVPSPSDSNKKSPEQWKAAILAQKNGVAALQAQIEKLGSSIRFVEANAYYNGVEYNQHQAKKQAQVEQMKTQLAEQKKKLEDTQEAARKAGMGSAVYDP